MVNRDSDLKSLKNILLISSHMSQANIEPFSNCIDILKNLSNELFVVANYDTDCVVKEFTNVHLCSVIYHFNKNSFKIFSFKSINIILNYLVNQIRVAKCIVKNSKDTNLCAFYLCDLQIIPLIVSKILGKKIILVLGGSLKEAIVIHNYPLGSILCMVQSINLKIADRIILYTPRLIEEWNFEKYSPKISIAHKHFLNFDQFSLINRFEYREDLVGYVGRLSREKGILNFIKSVPILIKQSPNLKFLIIGDGKLKGEIKCYVEKMNLSQYVTIKDWVPHEDLPVYLNQMKFTIIPSYTEGLPNIMLESMACGSIVIANSVGSIPDVIVDKKTGYLLQDNSPECIASIIQKAYNSVDLNLKIIENAYACVKTEFSYATAAKQYREIIKDVMDN